MDMCDILDQAVAVYRENFVVLLGVYAVGYLPFWLLVGSSAHFLSGALIRAIAYTGTSSAPEPEFLEALLGLMLLLLVVFAAVFIVEPVVTGAMARAVSEQLLGRRTTIRAAYRALRGRVPALVLSSLVRLIAVYGAYNVLSLLAFVAGLPAPLLGIGGITLVLVLHLAALLAASLLFIYLAFLGQIIVIEQRGTADALTRSWRLVSGRLWRTSATAGFLVLLVVALTLAFQLPAFVALGLWGPLADTPEGAAVMTILVVIILAITSLLASPIMAVGSTVMYYDLRVRREGFDMAMMAAAVGENEGTA